MIRPAPDALARKALAFDLGARDRRELERKAAALDRLAEWLGKIIGGETPGGFTLVEGLQDEIMKVLEGK